MPQVWVKFYLWENLSDTSLHSSGVLGQVMYSLTYSSMMACQTSRTITETLHEDFIDDLFCPGSRWQRVRASFSPGSSGSRNAVYLFKKVLLGPPCSSSSSNIAGNIHRKLMNETWSSALNSTKVPTLSDSFCDPLSSPSISLSSCFCLLSASVHTVGFQIVQSQPDEIKVVQNDSYGLLV